MAHANHVDRRHNQTQERYAADDLETMQEARRYSAHLFDLFRGHIGRRVLEVGSGIGTMSRRLADAADVVVGLEPNVNCITRLEDAMRGHPRFSLHACHLEECDRAELLSHRFDTVVCVNVLEHIEDDAAALRTFKDVLGPEGPRADFRAGCPGRVRPARCRTGPPSPILEAHAGQGVRRRRAGPAHAALHESDRPGSDGCTTRTSASRRRTA